jgi:NADPH:quinone reductase-like Zn-dependent oxidoreductase
MKAAVLYGADADPVYDDVDDPAAGPDTELVDLVAAGIHHVTRSVASGRHYSRASAFPVIPGLNAVARDAAGRLVFTASAPPPHGTLAERIVSPDAMRFPLPAGASPEAVAAGVNPGLASWLPLRALTGGPAGPLGTGSLGTVLVLGVTGMSGYLAVQNARLLGAGRVIGAGRSPAGLDRAAAAGAKTVALTGDRDADAAALAGALDGVVPGLVLDFVWGPVAETAFRALGDPGLGGHSLAEDAAGTSYVQIGALGGAEAAVPSALLRSRKVTISGSGLGSVSPAEIKAQVPDYIGLIADGSVQVPYRTFPLSDIGAAWAASAQSGPRVVVVPG